MAFQLMMSLGHAAQKGMLQKRSSCLLSTMVDLREEVLPVRLGKVFVHTGSAEGQAHF